jgi:hypothetical protein
VSDARRSGFTPLIRALIVRRSRRAWWMYLPVFLCYAFLALAASFELPASSRWLLPLPLLVIVIQWLWPTILGWALIAVPTVLYAVGGVAFALRQAAGPGPSRGSLRLSLAFLAILAVSLAGALFATRPGRSLPSEQAPQPDAP